MSVSCAGIVYDGLALADQVKSSLGVWWGRLIRIGLYLPSSQLGFKVAQCIRFGTTHALDGCWFGHCRR